MEDNGTHLMRSEAHSGDLLHLEHLILGIIDQLTRDQHHADIWINKGLKDIGELLGLERAYMQLTDQNFVLKNQPFLWSRIEADCRPIPQYTMETLRGDILRFTDNSTIRIILPMSLQDRIIGYMGFESESCPVILTNENIAILQIFDKLITHILDQNNKYQILSRNEEKFRRLFYCGADMIFVNRIREGGMPGLIIEANNLVLSKLGYTRDELFSTNLSKLGMPIKREDMENVLPALLSGETVCYEMVFFSKDGAQIPVEIYALMFELDYEKAVITVARDITERKKIERKLIENNEQLKKMLSTLEHAQKQMIQQEKLACIGQLAAGIAHEVNNPLGFVSSNFETTKKYCSSFKETMAAYKNFVERIEYIPPEDTSAEIQYLHDLEEKNSIDFILSDQGELFSDIEDGLKRISEIILGLKAFSRQDQSEKFEEYDLNKSIRNSLLITRNDFKYHATIQENLSDIPKIQACGSRIDQVLINLILNASDAIKERNLKEFGLITIATDVEDGFVRCQIEDNGVGIDQQSMDKIFDPFYTTKPPGKGTGMGLSIAYDIIVNQHNGQVFVDSSPMVGTRFIILLPVRQAEAKQVTENE